MKKSVSSYSKVRTMKTKGEGYPKLNRTMGASHVHVSRPDMSASPAQKGVTNATYKNKR